MLQGMYSGISAIEAQQTNIDVIGNNIANVNTTAYKAGQVTFEDQLSQTIQGASAPAANVGGVNAQQVGLGVKVAAISTLMAQGGLQSTTTPTNMAIQGNGFFMLGDSTGVTYTRDGSFSLDNNGNLVNSSNGSYVLGWKADPNGNIDASQQITPASHLSIPVGGLTAVQPTSAIAFGGNLSAESTTYVAPSAGPPPVPASGTPPYTRTVKVYDSLGEPGERDPELHPCFGYEHLELERLRRCRRHRQRLDLLRCHRQGDGFDRHFVPVTDRRCGGYPDHHAGLHGCDPD